MGLVYKNNITISACIITLNEQSCIRNALNNIKGHFDEIVVIDGGSTDATFSIASEYTDKVYVNKFENDFAKQRNYAIEKCTSNWIFMLDADETIEEDLLLILRDMLELNNEVDIFAIPRENTIEKLNEHPELIAQYGWNVDNDGRINFPDYQLRLFKNDYPRVKWINKVHEKIDLSGLKYAMLDGYRLFHHKTWERQAKQNSFYDKIIKNEI